MNCICRAVPVPYPRLSGPVMRPNDVGEVTAVPGAPRFTRLKALNASHRNSILRGPLIVKRFCNARSIWNSPGARTVLRPAFPHVPGRGSANAAGLNHYFRRLVRGIDMARSATRSARWAWSCCRRAGRSVARLAVIDQRAAGPRLHAVPRQRAIRRTHDAERNLVRPITAERELVYAS